MEKCSESIPLARSSVSLDLAQSIFIVDPENNVLKPKRVALHQPLPEEDAFIVKIDLKKGKCYFSYQKSDL